MKSASKIGLCVFFCGFALFLFFTSNTYAGVTGSLILNPDESGNFTASVSDPDCGVYAESIKYEFNWGDGTPSTIVGPIDYNSCPTPSAERAHSWSSAGSPNPKTVTVIATDKHGLTSTATHNVTINRPPTANAGSAHALKVKDSHTHSGASASDPDNNLASFAWSLVSKPTGSATTLSGNVSGTLSGGSASVPGPMYTPDKGGDYKLKLTITDSKGLVSSSEIIEPTGPEPKNNPVANAGSAHGLTVGQSHSHSGASASDVDGNLANYSWSFVSCPASCPGLGSSSGSLSGSSASILGPSFTPNSSGNYTLRLTVTDTDSRTGTSDVTETASVGNQAPTANAGSGHSITVGSAHTHSGASASDPDNNLASFAWSLVSKPTGSATTLSGNVSGTLSGGSASVPGPTYTPDKSGSYTIRLTVTDSGGLSGTSDVSESAISVIPPQCSDGIDNDGDGRIDLDDPDCQNDPKKDKEDPAQNAAPAAEAGISTNGSTYTSSITVVRGQAVNLWLSTDKDVSGDTKVSYDPNGWTHATYGVSSGGGKCEWNSDLNQGSPTYEQTITNPASAGACNVSLGSKTFNDTPGTYTYQVLKITDRASGISNVSSVSVTIVSSALPQCSDGIDNDGDGRIDLDDPDCQNDPKKDKEDPAQNASPTAEAGISTNGSTYTSSITVVRGQAVNLWLSTDKDVSGDTKVSYDPNGWTHATYGVSSGGGKCEWNSDLNQGSPTYEQTITNPASAGACNVSLGSRTFNDAPGTYTYQVLKITDRATGVSNVSSVSVTVVSSALPQCSDGIDNDGDGKTDYPSDPGCSGPGGINENPLVSGTDLIIPSAASKSPSNPKPGDEISFTVVIRNQGTQSTSASKAKWRLDASNDGDWDIDGDFLKKNVPALGSGEEKSITWDRVYTAGVGTHRYQICADVDNQVSEANEGNNCFEEVFTIAGSSATVQILDSGNNPPPYTLTEGEVKPLKALYDPDGPSGPQAQQDVTNQTDWTSTNAAYICVNNGDGGCSGTTGKGQIKAQLGSAGQSANINAAYGGLVATANVSVAGGAGPLGSCSLSLTPSVKTIKVKDALRIAVGNAVGRVTAIVDRPLVVEIVRVTNNSIDIRGLARGRAVITVNDDGISGCSRNAVIDVVIPTFEEI